MAKEIERKFQVKLDGFHPEGTMHSIKQGYLCCGPKKVIRIRTFDDKAFLTIKGEVTGISRDEFEYPVPYEEALQLFGLCEGFLIEKKRWKVQVSGKTWEIDFFEKENEGLVVAEIELDREEESFVYPSWLGQEVSEDIRYYNYNLSKNPYSAWQ